VHRKGREREKKREDLLARAQIRTVSFILIYHKHSSVDVALERG
jgi:hypothetical protein